MRAAVYHGPFDLRVEEVPDARIEEPTDVVVRVRTASMCGSDLYLFGGEVDALVAPGHTTLGHEVCAEVVEVGSEVARVRTGDRVTFPYSVSCGTCANCRMGQTAHCLTTASAIFGYGTAFGDLGGTHAEFVRVPLADAHVEVLPDSISDEEAVFLSCNLPAALTVVDAAEIGLDDRVAVVGCGPTGLLALELARARTQREIYAIDPVQYRRDAAAARGAIPIGEHGGDVVAEVLERTGGLGVDRVIEMAGRGPALDTAIAIARPGAIVSGGGVYLERDHPTSLFDAFFKNLTLRLNGFSNTRPVLWQASQLIEHGIVEPEQLLSHEVRLEDLPAAAKRFASREPGVFKLLIRP
jgi:threonine dehydrogenase-like Zn-dependent dehydrogenase